uniref:Uncharacterized protein n=1 Tax=Anguilla anguilla TaxID=7936 RepID=A0A0E9V6B2_ANGAN
MPETHFPSNILEHFFLHQLLEFSAVLSVTLAHKQPFKN